MPYSLGVDLGASFTAVAIADEVGTHAAQLSPMLVVPSAVYVPSDGELLTGDEAVRAGEADPSRLVTSFKKRLGDPTPLVVAGMQFTAEELMAAQLREVVAEVAEQRGEPAQDIALTYPVTWGPYRAEHFARIADLSGIGVSTSITEPVAVATHLDAQGGMKQGDVVAIVDFGSDAVTITLLRKGIGGFDILGTPEEIDRASSADFDDAMRTLLDQKLGGMISALDPANPAEASLLVAIDNACRAAKETLSTRREAAVSITLPDGAHRMDVTREEFTRLIRPSVRLAVDALRRAISLAELDDQAISSIVLAGGASRIPVVAEEFAAIERPVRSVHHPKLMVALGAARAAHALSTGTASPGALVESAGDSPRARSLWPPSRRGLIGIALAGLIVLVAIAATLIVPALLSGPPQAQAPDGFAGAPSASGRTTSAEPPESVFPVTENGKTPSSLHWYAATAGEFNSWGVAALEDGAAEMPGISLEETEDGLHARWSTPDWESQIYAQMTNSESVDLEKIVAADGALVFDLRVLSGAASSLRVAAHCTFPCSGPVDVTDTVAELGPDTTTHMIIPAQCFTSNGLDAGRVNTPFLLIGQGDIVVNLDDIRWERDSGKDPDALTC
ncbi:Hsp70 family protein [Microbacterium sp. NPDC058342]|uniref:Hsp70 family protein n=1 Tax=Microbacterium sp. NPDC058342 TaxID=3346454 RepID=UPI003666A506